MNRHDAIRVLRKIMANCASFYDAQAVIISQNKETKSWVLGVSWTPSTEEEGCLGKILDEYNLESVSKNGHTVFRSIQKS